MRTRAVRHRLGGGIGLPAGVRTQASKPSLAYKGYLNGRIRPDQCTRMTWHETAARNETDRMRSLPRATTRPPIMVVRRCFQHQGGKELDAFKSSPSPPGNSLPSFPLFSPPLPQSSPRCQTVSLQEATVNHPAAPGPPGQAPFRPRSREPPHSHSGGR